MKGMLIIGGISALIITVLAWQLNHRIEQVGLYKATLDAQKGELAEAADANKDSQDVITELEVTNSTLVAERAVNAKRTAEILAERDKKFRKAVLERDIARSETHDILHSTESCAAYSSIIVPDVCPAIADKLRQRADSRPGDREAEDSGEAGGSVPATPIPADRPGSISTFPIG